MVQSLVRDLLIPSATVGESAAVPITVVVLTFNEERNIACCLSALRMHFEDVHVLDSGSTDGTRDIASQMGATVHVHAFSGFGEQRNWAIDNIRHRYDWVLHLDADERPTDEFVAELKDRVASKPAEAGFYVPSKLMLGERWLRYSSGYPVYQVRLFHRHRLRFVNHGHGQREKTAGKMGYLRTPYLHYAFSKGVQDWFEKHAKYAAAEALQVQNESWSTIGSILNCLSRDAIHRRRALKRLSYLLPARPYLRLAHTLILKRGLLDGRAGIAYARAMAAYEAIFEAYVSMMKASKRTEPRDCLGEEREGCDVR